MKRLLSPLILALGPAMAGCMTLDTLAGDPIPRMERIHPQEAYAQGVALYKTGDVDAARREWNRCLALAPQNSPTRLDCLVALEELTSSRHLLDRP